MATGVRKRLPRVPVRRILQVLSDMYPDARTALHFHNPFELLIATMLSAQCTDKRVNLVTARLFSRFATPGEIAALTPEQLGEMIRDCGLWRNKSRNIVATCRILCERYGGEVPRERAALEALPGVGRKTANVVLANAFDIPALAVDTHVFRVANRLGLADSANVRGTEEDLMRRIPRSRWASAHHWLIHHGRRLCVARNPRCGACPLAADCRFAKGAESS